MSKGVHRFALIVAGATFFLILAGAKVTSHDAGLATYDWPLSNGQVFPEMVGNLFWEHGHRLIAATVGLLTIALAVYIQIRERRSWVKRLAWVALGGVIAQGLLGGLTVKLNLPLAVSTAHATLAQLFFLTTVSLAVFTSQSWIGNLTADVVRCFARFDSGPAGPGSNVETFSYLGSVSAQRAIDSARCWCRNRLINSGRDRIYRPAAAW
jgi:heme A synthase